MITGTSNFNSSGEITNFNIDNNGRISIHEGFVLIQGEVIQRAGLDEASIDYLNLVSRYHSIQAQITAKERIQILSGNHNYDYTNSIVDSTTATNSANGEFAVDISALGNIQAGSIFFKATEAGLGIRSNGNLISSVTGVSIDSAGKLHLGNITSTQGIRLNSTAEITTSSNSVFQARKNIDIKATDIALNSILTQEDFNANTDGIFEIQTGGRLTIESNYFTNNSAALISSISTTDIQTTENFINRGAIYSFTDLILTAGVSTDGGTYLKSNYFLNEGGWIEANRDLEIHSNKIENKYKEARTLTGYNIILEESTDNRSIIIAQVHLEDRTGQVLTQLLVDYYSSAAEQHTYSEQIVKEVITDSTSIITYNDALHLAELKTTYKNQQIEYEAQQYGSGGIWTYQGSRSGINNWDYTQIEHPELAVHRGKIYSGGNMKLIAQGDITNNTSYIRSNGDLHIEGNNTCAICNNFFYNLLTVSMLFCSRRIVIY